MITFPHDISHPIGRTNPIQFFLIFKKSENEITLQEGEICPE